jgi:hypothetical protein
VGHSFEVLHLTHSLDPQTGGVCSAVELLNDAMVRAGIQSRISEDPKVQVRSRQEWIIAHGLWQWPGRVAQNLGNPYLVYPHGMLDPWFKKTYPFKHLKKQFYSLGTPMRFALLPKRNRLWHKRLFSRTKQTKR